MPDKNEMMVVLTFAKIKWKPVKKMNSHEKTYNTNEMATQAPYDPYPNTRHLGLINRYYVYIFTLAS